MKELLPIKPPKKLRQGIFTGKKARMLQGYDNKQLGKTSKVRLLKIRIKYPAKVTDNMKELLS